MRRERLFEVLGGILSIVAVTLLLAGSASAATYKTLYKFSGTDGEAPDYELTFDAAGNLYGAACLGGAYGYGVIFELAPNPDGSWTESALHQFTGGPDGGCPLGGLVFDAAGNLYGVTYCYTDYVYCGTTFGTVFELMPNLDGTWTENVLYDFTGGTDGAYPAGPVVFDAQGNIYGGVMGGGAYGSGGVFKLTPNPDGTWAETVIHNFTGGKDGGHLVGGVIFDAAGNLYGATYWGGNEECVLGCGVAFELAPNADGSWTEKVIHNFTGQKDGANPGHGLLFDAAGNLYGATFWGTYSQSCGKTCGTVYELTPNPNGTWTPQIPHNFSGGRDGATPYGNLIGDAAGNLYGTTIYGGAYGYGVVFELTPNSAGGWNYHLLLTFNDKPGAYPHGGVIPDAAGNLYGTTWGDGTTTFGTVYEITP